MDQGGPLILVRSAPEQPQSARTAADRMRGSGAGPQRGSWYLIGAGGQRPEAPPRTVAFRDRSARGRKERPPVRVDPAVSLGAIGAPCAPPVSGPCGRRGP